MDASCSGTTSPSPFTHLVTASLVSGGPTPDVRLSTAEPPVGPDVSYGATTSWNVVRGLVWKLTPGIGWRYGLHMGDHSGFSIS